MQEEGRVYRNRLGASTSAYLLQHARNPVDWYPWGEEALEEARIKRRPIFLSIGYSACHWCHVMERETFEDESVGAFLNEHFVNIKVDREERPDLDSVCMNAVHVVSGTGGWPMSVFLTPELKPYYGGTYYPPVDVPGRPSFVRVARAMASAWEEREGEVRETAAYLWRLLCEIEERLPESPGLGSPLLDGALEALGEDYDAVHGGFGQAPKFPSPGAVELLIRGWVRTGESRWGLMAERTLEQMARGGIHDHVGGGFHRYTVDGGWVTPHFEKMLYDNAQLASAYLLAHERTGRELYAKVAEDTLDYMVRDLYRVEEGGGAFCASEDADSEGEEGRFYLWEPSVVMECLGPGDGGLFSELYGVLARGEEAGEIGVGCVLHMTEELGVVAARHGVSEDELEARMGVCLEKLREAREQRVRPGRDGKFVTAWNGMAVSALARAALVLGRTDCALRAVDVAGFVMGRMTRGDVLLRTYPKGGQEIPGFLEDYAGMCVALLDVYEAVEDGAWRDAAEELAARMDGRFFDEGRGVYFMTGPEHGAVITRPLPLVDGAEPCGNSMAALALGRLASATGKVDYRDRGLRLIDACAGRMAVEPRLLTRMACALEACLGGT